jgi:hypothetical protein
MTEQGATPAQIAEALDIEEPTGLERGLKKLDKLHVFWGNFEISVDTIKLTKSGWGYDCLLASLGMRVFHNQTRQWSG